MDYQKIEKEKLEEKQRADEAMAEVEKLKYELEDKTDKNAQLEKQNSEIAEQLMDEKEKNKAEIKAFVKKIDVVKKDLENEKKIGDEAKMRVNELQQRLPELHKIIQDEKDGKEKVKTELSESQNLLKLKEALISDLQKMNDEKIGEIKKAQTVSKAFQDEIVQFQAEVADLKEEVLKWKITCDSYRRKKNELSDKNEKKKDVIEENVKEIRNLKKMLDKCGNKDKSILNVQQKQDILKVRV
uniref:Uncharacterized protein n=1 Tax=Panagrolaimus superbus TaxID=310955 RepID=A0A914ZBS4_9BILA